MKLSLLIICLSIVTTSFATEVSTDCVAMNEVSREKIIKTQKPTTNTRKGATSQ